MTIRSRVATDEYRANWDRVFGKPERFPSPEEIRVPPLNPHDAQEHPSAD